MNKFVVFILVLGLSSLISGIDVHIPNHILDCYRQNATQEHNKMQIPMTIQLLIELLQNVEEDKYFDMRLATTSMLYRLKFDGIQRLSSSYETENIVPVGPTAIHFNKFRLLLTYLLSGDEQFFPDESLSMAEFCTLHRLLSSSVQAWERGDEARTCPQIKMMPSENPSHNKFIQGKQISSCPIEKGVLRSPWGDISGGHLVMGVAAALQNQDVKLMQILSAINSQEHTEIVNDKRTRNIQRNIEGDVNNLWAASLAGDLGEVVAYQSMFVQDLVISPGGTWNDTMLPRAYYLPSAIGSHWEMTMAESIAGIDAVIIGSAISDWTNKLGRLRLSQVLDMYYSRQGVFFDDSYKACLRKEKIKKVLEEVDLVKQTSGMAKLLQNYYLSNPSQEWVPVPDEHIEEYSRQAVNKFVDNLDALTGPYSACEKGFDIPAADIFAVMDGTWSEHDARRLVAALAHAADVSRYGSSIGFISGNNGAWMTNVSHKVFQLFEDLAKPDVPWPSTLSVSESLATISQYLNNKTDQECINKFRSTRTSVILIIATTDTINSIDLERTKSLIKIIKGINPSNVILYVTSDESFASYEELTKMEYLNDVIVKTQKTVEAVVQSVSEKLKDIPRQIIELHCDVDMLEYEDYITPKVTTTYEIPYKILQDVPGEINVKFSGHENGNMSICASDKDYPGNTVCQWVDDRNVSVEFATKPFCHSDYACNVQFKVSLENSKNKCTDNECRYPQQARIGIRTSWGSAASSSSYIAINYVSLLFCYILYSFFLYK